MTDQEYTKQVADLLQQVPSNFHNPLTGFAWNYGHAAGLHEVVHILKELIEEVITPSLQTENNKRGNQ